MRELMALHPDMSTRAREAGHLSESDRATRCPTEGGLAAGSRILAQTPWSMNSHRRCQLLADAAIAVSRVVTVCAG